MIIQKSSMYFQTKKERLKRSRGAAVKITVIFADSQSDCSKNIPPSNMRNISCSLTNQIADILYVDDNKTYCREQVSYYT